LPINRAKIGSHAAIICANKSLFRWGIFYGSRLCSWTSAKCYESEMRSKCGNFVLVRNGTCMKCDKCGGTTGTSAIIRLCVRSVNVVHPAWFCVH
jgi:hypothetical protein